MEPRPELNIPEMDAQHRYLYDLFDLIVRPEVAASREKTAALLKEIEGYLNFHFTSEEHLIRHYRVPGFSAHQADHEQAAREFISYLDDFERGEYRPGRMRQFLVGWLVEHSLAADMPYAEHIRRTRQTIG